MAINHRTGTGGLDFIRECFKLSTAGKSFWGFRHPSSGLSSGLHPAPIPWDPWATKLHCGYQVPFSVSKEAHLMVLLALCLPTSHSRESATLPEVGAAIGRGWLSLHPIVPCARLWGAESDSLCSMSTVEPKLGLSPGFLFYALSC